MKLWDKTSSGIKSAELKLNCVSTDVFIFKSEITLKYDINMIKSAVYLNIYFLYYIDKMT